MRTSMFRAAIAAAFAWVALPHSVALAEPAPVKSEVPDARLYFNAGARAYATGKYAAAIRAFEEAYRIELRPGLVFSIAQAHRRQYFIDKTKENLLAAIQHYRKYLELEPDGPRRGDAAEALSELEPFANKLAPSDAAAAPAAKPATQLMISSPIDDVTIVLDGKPAGTLPYIAAVTPGVHNVTLTAPGYLEYRRDVRVLDGSVVPLDVTLEEMPAKLSVVAPDGARIAIDGRFRGVSPSPPLEVPAGRHFVTVTENGHEAYSREITLGRDEKRTLTAELPATTQRTVAWIFMGLGGTAVLAGTGLMVAAVVREDSAKSTMENLASREDIRVYTDTVASRDELRTAGIATAASGLAVATIGLFLFAFDEPRAGASGPAEAGAPEPARPRREPSPGLDVSALPWFSANGGGAALRGTF
jgi:hypothetical protein